MIIKTRSGSDMKIMAEDWGYESYIPMPGAHALSQSGVAVSSLSAYGLPAVSSVIRAPSEIIASMPFMVYKDDPDRTQARDSWQWSVLHDLPNEEMDSYEFIYDLGVSLESTQNAFVQKVKVNSMVRADNGQVVALSVLDPARVTVRQAADGSKLFDIWISPSEIKKGLTTDDILHIRGFTPKPGGVAGVSLLLVHRDPIGAAIAMQKFEGDFFRNGAVPPFFFTGSANRQQAQDILDAHNANHRGVGNQNKVGSLWGNTGVHTMSISLADAQFIEAKNLSIEDCCRIWRWPRRLLEIGEVREPTIDLNVADSELLKLYVLPRLRRIERALAADPDIFYGTGLFGEFLSASLERGDVHSRYDAYRLARQGGWVTANELRQWENLPAHENGDDLQLTPVGGAPNPPDGAAGATPSPAQNTGTPAPPGGASDGPEVLPVAENGHGRIDLQPLLKE